MFYFHGIGRFEQSQFELRIKREKYSKYLFYWHRRFQASKWHSRASFFKKRVTGVGRHKDLRTNPFQEEVNDWDKASTGSSTWIEVYTSLI